MEGPTAHGDCRFEFPPVLSDKRSCHIGPCGADHLAVVTKEPADMVRDEKNLVRLRAELHAIDVEVRAQATVAHASRQVNPFGSKPANDERTSQLHVRAVILGRKVLSLSKRMQIERHIEQELWDQMSHHGRKTAKRRRTDRPLLRLRGPRIVHIRANAHGKYADLGAMCRMAHDFADTKGVFRRSIDSGLAVWQDGDRVDERVPGTYLVRWQCANITAAHATAVAVVRRVVITKTAYSARRAQQARGAARAATRRTHAPTPALRAPGTAAPTPQPTPAHTGKHSDLHEHMNYGFWDSFFDREDEARQNRTKSPTPVPTPRTKKEIANAKHARMAECYSPWGGWGGCDRLCDSGVQHRTRTALFDHRSHHGHMSPCPRLPVTEKAYCNLFACATKLVTYWKSKRTQRIAVPADVTISYRPDLSKPCRHHVLSSRWTICTAECGAGLQLRWVRRLVCEGSQITMATEIGKRVCTSGACLEGEATAAHQTRIAMPDLPSIVGFYSFLHGKNPDDDEPTPL